MRLLLILSVFLFVNSAYSQTVRSLVPEQPSKAPDYFCTWNIQGYISSYKSNEAQREAMQEKNMFGEGPFQNWINFFPQIRKDLFFVMDDSWDIPLSENTSDNKYLGQVELSPERFENYTGNPDDRLKKLTNAVKNKGWKGLGGWICAQESPVSGKIDQEKYWIERLITANKAGFGYWKVDWGKSQNSIEWRQMLTTLGRKYAPNLIIEHAIDEKFISIADVYRTYDVENVVAQPVTLDRISKLLKYKPIGYAKAIINCEDEPYIAVGLGCAIGIMRHPFTGNLPDGTIDFVFPPVGRNIKFRMDEVIRAVRWHRIAEPFGIGSDNYHIDTVKLTDKWVIGTRDTYVDRKTGDTLKANAPARISRGLPLPEITNTKGNPPFVLSSEYPNGATAIATIGRAIDREYITERVKVEQQIKSLRGPIGIFGDYEELTLVLPQNVSTDGYNIWGQDLVGDTPLDITKEVIIKRNKIIIPGDVIRKVGLLAKTKGDLSDPGLVIKFQLADK